MADLREKFRVAVLSVVKHDYLPRAVAAHPRFELVVVTDDAGKLLLPDDDIHFSMHLFPIGREVVGAQIQIGVWLYPEGEDPKFATNDEILFNSGESRDLGLPRYTDLLIPPHG